MAYDNGHNCMHATDVTVVCALGNSVYSGDRSGSPIEKHEQNERNYSTSVICTHGLMKQLLTHQSIYI